MCVREIENFVGTRFHFRLLFLLCLSLSLRFKLYFSSPLIPKKAKFFYESCCSFNFHTFRWKNVSKKQRFIHTLNPRQRLATPQFAVLRTTTTWCHFALTLPNIKRAIPAAAAVRTRPLPSINAAKKFTLEMGQYGSPYFC